MKALKKKKMSNTLNQYGSILFGVGLLLAIAVAFMNIQNATVNKVILGTLILLGLAIGVLNLKNSEEVSFIVAVIALVMLTGPLMGVVIKEFAISGYFATVLGKLFSNIITLLVPAATIVAIKAIFATAKDE